MRKRTIRCLTGGLCAALLCAACAVSVFAPPAPAASAEDWTYEETFAGTNGGLPDGWEVVSASDSGTAEVTDGKLTLTSAGNYDKNLIVRLPARFPLENFSFSVRFKMKRTTDGNDGRYLGLMVRGDYGAAPVYFQMAVRQNCSKDSGIELAERTAAGWSVPGRFSYDGDTLTGGKLDPDRTYAAEVRVYGQKIYAWFEGVKLGGAVMPDERATDDLALQVCNNVTEIESVAVVPLEAPKYMGLAREYNTTGGAADPPAAVEPVESAAAYASLKTSNTRPGSAIFTLDASLRAVGADGAPIATIEEVFAQLDKKVIPVFRVPDAATADAFVAFMNETEAEDVSVVSDDGEALKRVRTACKEARGVFETPAAPQTDAERLAIRDAANRSLAKTALLSFAAADARTIRYLQRRLISVWVRADTAEEVREAVLKGADGIVGNYADVYDVTMSLPDGARLKPPIVVGHRGYCPEGSGFPENSLEAALAAYENGADAIENDVYMTTDNHFVIAHDNEVSKFGALNNDGSPASGTLESMTLSAVKTLYLRDGKTRIPTLEEYFDAFKDKDVLHYTEIKTFNPDFAAHFAALVREKGVSGQIDLISFAKPAVYERLAELLPEISIGYLNQDRAYQADQIETPETVLAQCVPLNATYHPFYQKVTADLVRRLNNRGIQVNPWTLNTSDAVQAGIDRGYGSLTTDKAGEMKALVETLSAPGALTLPVDGMTVGLTAVRKTGGAETVAAEGAVVLSGKLRLAFEEGVCRGTAVAGEKTCVAAFYYRAESPLGSYLVLTGPVEVTLGGADPVPEPEPDPDPGPGKPTDKGCGCGSAAAGGSAVLGIAALAAALSAAYRRRAE